MLIPGRTTNYEEMIETSLSESKDYLKETMRRIMFYSIKGAVTGIPICALGEEYECFYHRKNESLQLFPHLSVGPFVEEIQDCTFRPESSKGKGPECHLCKYYEQCEGLQQRYIQRYGFGDLKPII